MGLVTGNLLALRKGGEQRWVGYSGGARPKWVERREGGKQKQVSVDFRKPAQPVPYFCVTG